MNHPFHHGGGLTTLISAVGVALTTLCPKMWWFGHPILAKGVAPISFSSFLFFFSNFFSFLFFFKKKINGQNDVVLGWVVG
jgi:hypothetical protein